MCCRRILIDGDEIPDFVFEHVFSRIHAPSDRGSISQVSKRWYEIEGRTRKDVTISCCYAIDPARLTGRFLELESIKLKGKPRASMFRLLPDNWGGYATPWISEIAGHCHKLNSLHLRRMIVSDDDLCKLAEHRGNGLHVLKLDRCSGFSTIGIRAVARACRSCPSLKSLKLHEVDLACLKDLLNSAALQELGGILVDYDGLRVSGVRLPESLTSLVGLCHMGIDDADITINSLVQPIAKGLKKIDLQFTFLSVAGHCELLRNCPNLEDLEVFNAIGDEGLKVISLNCTKLRRLRIERGDRDVQQGFVTHEGLLSIASSCHQLEYIAVYVSDINNAALMAIATNCRKLQDFRLVLLDEEDDVTECQLDVGVMELVQKCSEIRRLALYLRRGFLTDSCMGYLGKYGRNLKWALFGLLGETDMGLKLFAENCPNIEKLEMRDCVFTELGIATSVLKMASLKYIWVQGYNCTGTGRDLLPMKRACWKVEMIPASTEEQSPDGPLSFLAYRSLAGWRSDIPNTVICLG